MKGKAVLSLLVSGAFAFTSAFFPIPQPTFPNQPLFPQPVKPKPEVKVPKHGFNAKPNSQHRIGSSYLPADPTRYPVSKPFSYAGSWNNVAIFAVYGNVSECRWECFWWLGICLNWQKVCRTKKRVDHLLCKSKTGRDKFIMNVNTTDLRLANLYRICTR